MDYRKKTHVISNSYYNMGLERANLRDLSGAAESLKKSLRFNKYQTDARNLLGLIYYEMGEVGDALVQWVISMNLQPENNRADYYLGEIQRKKGSLDSERHIIRRFNQALAYAQSGSEDLALLQLGKIVEQKPNYVKAQLLLAVLSIAGGDYQKAGKAVYKVLTIDRNNPRALWYKTMVKAAAGEKSKRAPERRRLKNAMSHRQMEDDDVILPPSYKENTKDQAVIYILAGLILGAAVLFFLVMPANTKAINVRHNREMIKYSESLSQANNRADGLEAQIAALEEEKKAAEDSLNAVTNDTDSALAQYQNMIQILDAYRKNDFQSAVLIYAGMNTSLITTPEAREILNGIQADMEANGYQVLEGLGDLSLSEEKPEEALDYYLKCLNIKPDYWQVKYKTAVLYKQMNQMDAANELFTDIINNSKDEALSAQATTERGF